MKQNIITKMTIKFSLKKNKFIFFKKNINSLFLKKLIYKEFTLFF